LPYPPTQKTVGQELYATPRHGLTVADCWFYHTMDLPGYGTLKGPWDLRLGLDDYVGRLDYRGKRVLEFGAASGGVSFGLEQRGARVVAFDLAPHLQWDIVPLASYPNLSDQIRDRQAQLEQLRNSFWLAHEALRSKVHVVYGNIYDVPAAIGPVDTCVFGAILLHLRQPFAALESGAKLAQDKVVVTDYYWPPWTPFLSSKWASWSQRVRRKIALGLLRALRCLAPYSAQTPSLVFLPDPKNLDNVDTWWALSPGVVRQFLAVLGFEESITYTHYQLWNEYRQPMFTVVASRTRATSAFVQSTADLLMKGGLNWHWRPPS
jgi:hypothetical protein